MVLHIELKLYLQIYTQILHHAPFCCEEKEREGHSIICSQHELSSAVIIVFTYELFSKEFWMLSYAAL